jgi:hypothetical protein
VASGTVDEAAATTPRSSPYSYPARCAIVRSKAQRARNFSDDASTSGLERISIRHIPLIR